MPYDDSQSRRIGCATLAACAFGFIALLIFIVPSGEPGVHVAWEKNFAHPIESDCVEEALRAIAKDVHRSTYFSTLGSTRGFDRSANYIQFNYSDPTLLGQYSLGFAKLPDGMTRYWHQWGKIGTDISEQEKVRVVPLLNRVNEQVAQHCGLSFAGSNPQQGNGWVR
ncbi:hypothetical protein [Novosphingobium sp. UBA1939]|uniref:hypothetical protein n=1 Tax=Novosphingobium sp. UBA1939 TaxID=1946982 RepID=UPI0025F030FF|nr:hypothetical protein [Novosphingobium sp. UBA1939]